MEVKKNSSVYAAFVYNADGQRVKSTVSGVTIAYVGSYAEWSNSALTSYYYAGAAQIAMRQSGELIYVFGDHLGSTSKTYKVSNGETKMQLYTPWGERRYPTAASEISTRYRYTGQYEYSELGLYFYQSRWYDAALGRFAQADTIVPNPGDSQAWDRYAYVRNNPHRYVDPSGHYGIEVHYFLTYHMVYEIAMQTLISQGISSADIADTVASDLAKEVADGCLAADMLEWDEETQTEKINWSYENYAPYWLYEPPEQPLPIPGKGQSQQQTTETTTLTPHWYTTPQARELLQSATTPFEFGIGMHRFQDTFSHWQKLGKPTNPSQIYWLHFKNWFEKKKIDNFNPLNDPIDQEMSEEMEKEIRFWIYQNSWFSCPPGGMCAF